MASQDVVIINDFGGAQLEQRTRTTSTGTNDRMTVSIQAEPIIHDWSGLKLGEGPAKAIADLIKKQIRAVSALASPSTIKKRAAAVLALARGEPSARDRYTGGRIGPMQPGAASSDRLFNDSGRLAESIFVRENVNNQQGGTTSPAWTVNVAANRFDPKDFADGVAGVAKMVQRMIDAGVTALKGGWDLVQHPEVQRAIDESLDGAIFVASTRARAEKAAAWRDLIGTAWSTIGKPLLIG